MHGIRKAWKRSVLRSAYTTGWSNRGGSIVRNRLLDSCFSFCNSEVKQQPLNVGYRPLAQALPCAGPVGPASRRPPCRHPGASWSAVTVSMLEHFNNNNSTNSLQPAHGGKCTLGIGGLAGGGHMQLQCS